jgi:hypothetical protein
LAQCKTDRSLDPESLFESSTRPSSMTCPVAPSHHATTWHRYLPISIAAVNRLVSTGTIPFGQVLIAPPAPWLPTRRLQFAECD